MKTNQFLRGCKTGMQLFGQNIAAIVNTILLLIVYLFGVGLTSILAKITGKRFLNTTTSKKSKSYWNNLNLSKKKTEEYYRQF